MSPGTGKLAECVLQCEGVKGNGIRQGPQGKDSLWGVPCRILLRSFKDEVAEDCISRCFLFFAVV